jgi:hypothetical protein
MSRIVRPRSGLGRVVVGLPVFALLATLVALVLGLGPVHAQEFGSISGRVRDTNGNPVPGVLVGIFALDQPFSRTDAQGRYTVSGVPVTDAHYQLQLLAPCDDDRSRRVLVEGAETEDFEIGAGAERDDFGNTCRRATPLYEAGSTVVPLSGDDATTQVNLPFSFPFYGVRYSRAFVSTNGFISFTSNSSQFFNSTLPSDFAPPAMIAAYWDDLIVDAQANVRTRLAGSAPNRRFVIEWNNVQFFFSDNEFVRFNFEMVLFENGRILLQYRGIVPFTELHRLRGLSATVGIQNQNRTDGIQRSFNQPYLDDALAIEFNKPK